MASRSFGGQNRPFSGPSGMGSLMTRRGSHVPAARLPDRCVGQGTDREDHRVFRPERVRISRNRVADHLGGKAVSPKEHFRVIRGVAFLFNVPAAQVDPEKLALMSVDDCLLFSDFPKCHYQITLKPRSGVRAPLRHALHRRSRGFWNGI